MKRHIISKLISIFIVTSLISNAKTSYDTITLTDGSIISGYVTRDNLTNGDIVIDAEWAITSVPAEDVEFSIAERFAYRLDPQIKEWMRSNDFEIPEVVYFANITIVGDDCNPNYMLYDQALSPTYESYDKLLLEDGNILKYADLTPKRYLLNWSKIARIDHLTNGEEGYIETIVPIAGNPIEGWIESQVLRHHRTIKSTNGQRHTFIPKNIKSILKSPKDKTTSLLKTATTIDRIEMEESAGGEVIEGVIIENNRIQQFFIILVSNDDGETTIQIPYSEINALSYRRNL